MDIAVVGAGVSLTLDADGTLHRRRASRSARWRRRALLVDDGGQGADRHDARRRGARQRWPRPPRPPRKPIDDKRGTADFRIKVAGVLAPRAPPTIARRAREGAKQ